MNQKLWPIIGTALCVAYFWHYMFTFTDWHFIDTVNLIFHEAGHTILFFMPGVIVALAGSAFQIIIPLLIAIYFFYQEQNISASICLMWMGQNFLNVSVYAGDAINMNLDLLGGDSVIHDWNYILSNLNLLQHTHSIALTFFWIGILAIVIGSVASLNYAMK